MIKLTTPLTVEKIKQLHAGDEVLLSGTIYTGRDAACLLYTSPSPRDGLLSRMPSSA